MSMDVYFQLRMLQERVEYISPQTCDDARIKGLLRDLIKVLMEREQRD